MTKNYVTKKLLNLLELLIILFGVIFFTTHIFSMGIVAGRSMEPTYHDGEIIGIWHVNKKYKRDDVISFIYSQEQEDFLYEHFGCDVAYTQSQSSKIGEAHIKRVVGIPGDTIRIEAEEDTISLYVNDEIILENEYKSIPVEDIELTLGNDQYYVLGDNRDISLDSIYHGPVSKKDIVGKIIFAI